VFAGLAQPLRPNPLPQPPAPHHSPPHPPKKVEWYEAVLLALSYAAYVAVTAWLARADEPVTLDAAHREIPPEEALGGGS
jgi:hypothetical protein